MTDTANLGLPFIEGSQAQKHVTHNDALLILDAAIQIAVLDLSRTAPPSSPADGERHVVATGATGAWSGQANAIATWQDGAWAFLAPHTGWCIWSVADDVMFVFDGTHWRDLRDLPVTMDNAVHVGINTTASSPNLLSVKSNAALLAAINVADGGSGDARLQISKESSAKTASVFFADAFSGRAEFGLAGSDAFKLKVSPDGSAWADALSIDQSSGNTTLPRGVALSGVIVPPQITANQNDYNPAGLASASVMQLSSDAVRSISGLAGGAEGRILNIVNVGSQPITLLNESTSSSASNRITFGSDLTMAARQAAILRYDGTAARWQAISGAMGVLAAANNLADLASKPAARANLGVRDVLTATRAYYVRTDGSDSNTGLSNTAGGAFLTIQKAVDTVGLLDVGIYDVTINVANGTYTGAVTLKNFVGAGRCTITGTSSAIVSVTSNQAFRLAGIISLWTLQGIKITTTTSGSCIYADTNSLLTVDGVEFGACAGGAHMLASHAAIFIISSYTVSGGGGFHWYASEGGMIFWSGASTMTLTGTPAFSSSFANVLTAGVLSVGSKTFSGSATGVRYSVASNGVLNTSAGGASYLPGNSAGTTASGGQYI